MRIRFRGLEFAPTGFMTLATLVCFVLFVALGNWQLQRADHKRAIEQRFQDRLEQPYGYHYLTQDVDADMQYRKVRLRGEYDLDHLLLVDNKLHQGVAGYHVLMPFVIDPTGKAVWVNRGWVAAGYDRSILPAIRSPRVPDQVKGVVTIPSTEGFRMGTVDASRQWPKRVPYVDLEVINPSLDLPMLPYVVWLSPDVDDFYIREWVPVWSPPGKSEAYAVQWFSFALVVCILYLFLNTRRVTGDSNHD